MKKHNSPLISILIANYNNAEYIHDSVESVIAQSYKNWEIIFIDDGSDDDSLKAISNFKGNLKIKIFENKANKGCGFTKARCLQEANGVYCAFLDPDDTLEKDCIKKLYEIISKDENLSMVTSQHRVCDKRLNEVSISPFNKGMNNNKTYFTSNDFHVTAFTLFSKKKYEMTNGINIELKRAVDQDLYYKLDEVGSITFLIEVLYHYRKLEGSLASGKNSLKAKYWHALVINDTYYRRKKNGLSNISKDELNKVFEDYFIWKAIDKIEERSFCLGVFFILKSIAVRPLHNITYKVSLLKKLIFKNFKK